VPGDPDQVIYVWWDALGNYLTALGYASGTDELDRWWLLREISTGADADFTVGRLVARANDELANRFVNRVRPWDLAKAGDRPQLDAVLSVLLSACAAIGTHLAVFLPGAASLITRQCRPDPAGVIPAPAPVLPRLAPSDEDLS
jgi:methionyl-tRNA synthetase